MTLSNTLSLYRSILFCGKRFPSIKRDKIVLEIRHEFRKNKNLTDEREIAKCIAVATKGLSQLSMYTSLPKYSSNWSINLEENPMPRGVKE